MDLSKASSKENHKILRKKMFQRGISRQIVALVKRILNNTNIKVELNGQYSDFWRVKAA